MSSISIDLDAKTPPFEQIKLSVLGLIANGGLPVDHRLPTIRQLAGDLGVAPNTVARSYRELETDGVVRSRGRRGTVVIGLPARTPTTSALTTAVQEARRAGQTSTEILASVVQALSA